MFAPPLTNSFVELSLSAYFRHERPSKGNLQTPRTATNEETRDNIYLLFFAKTRLQNLTTYRGGRLLRSHTTTTNLYVPRDAHFPATCSNPT